MWQTGSELGDGHGEITELFGSSRDSLETPMIIGPDSPLRRLPTALDRKQALFLDGIRFSVEMADLAYQRLRHTLLNFESSFDRSAAYSPGVVAMIDAWVIIDNASACGLASRTARSFKTIARASLSTIR